MSQVIWRRLILSLMLLAFVVFVAWALYTFVTSRYPGANDFYQRWRASRAFWVEGRDPYSKEVARQIEFDLYGAPYNPDPALDEYPGDFLYAFPTALLLAPLTVLPYAVASAILLALIGTTAALAFVALVDLYNWRVAPWLLVVGILWAVTFYPAVRGLFLGQLGTLVVCLELITLWALAKNQDTLAGILLAISTFKPQLGLLFIPFLMLWALRTKRWRFVIVFGAGVGVLLGLSFLLLPSWLAEWLAQTSQYIGYTRIGSPIWIITSLYAPFLGSIGELAITLVLIGLTLYAWFAVLRHPDPGLFNWAAALTLTVTHLVLVRTATPHFVIYMVVIVFYFRELNRAGGAWSVVALMFALNAGLWWLFLDTLVNRFESPLMYLPLPWGSLFLLLLTRQLWRKSAQAPSPLVRSAQGIAR